MIKAMDLWLPGYMARKRIPPDYEGKTHIMLAVCDHFEPYHQADGSQKEALRRLDFWQTAFPKIQEGLLRNWIDHFFLLWSACYNISQQAR